ncbi:MAG TPA: hypothetical protein VIM58_02085 [Candidatus Methylacidiphilales bacterium]
MRSLLRTVLLLGLLAASLGLAATARAQLKIGLETERMNYLLYAPIPLKLTLENAAGFDLVFADEDAKPWLSFYITQDDGTVVAPDRKTTREPLSLAAGKRATLSLDLTPLYAMRSTGRYRIQAVVDVAGREYLSAPAYVMLQPGQTVWREKRPVDGSDRTYSLITFSPTLKNTDLYLRVEDESQNLVYTNVLLGEIVDLEVPATRFDPQGRLHVLSLAGNSLYRYSRASADGTIEAQMNYYSLRESLPHLETSNDGAVFVAGGRAENPTIQRPRLSDAQGKVAQPAPQ